MDASQLYQLRGLASDDNPASHRIVLRWIDAFEALADSWGAPMGVRTSLQEWRWDVKRKIAELERMRGRG